MQRTPNEGIIISVMKIHELKYSCTNTYLIEGSRGMLLFDTGLKGSFGDFCACMGELKIPVQDVDCILISHYHPDHMGIASEIAAYGPVILVTDVQDASSLECGPDKIQRVDLPDGRDYLKGLGIDGQIIHTPGHSDDSISLCLDTGEIFVGDLNPLYELELHKGTMIEDSWKRLLELSPKTVYYGHAKTAVLKHEAADPAVDTDLYRLTVKITKLIDKGADIEKIEKKTGADAAFIEDVARMYLTHRDISVMGILDRIESRRS